MLKSLLYAAGAHHDFDIAVFLAMATGPCLFMKSVFFGTPMILIL